MTFTMPFNRATRMRALTIGVLALGVLSVQVGRGTLAYFTTQVTSTGNVFSAGNLHFTINDNNQGPLTTVSSSIALANMKPGDSVYAPITISNIGSLDGQYGISYITSTDVNSPSTGLGLDMTPLLQLAIVGRGSHVTSTVTNCRNTVANPDFADTSLWPERIKPALTSLGAASATPVALVDSTSLIPPATLGTYVPGDVGSAYLPLDHTAGTLAADILCVQVTYPDGGDPSLHGTIGDPLGLLLGDNAFNATTAQSLNSTITFTFNGQQRNHPVEFDQTAGPTVNNF
jgi:predicted ribosomally synthesized peptide with SipW-like signal peptide